MWFYLRYVKVNLFHSHSSTSKTFECFIFQLLMLNVQRKIKVAVENLHNGGYFVD